MKRYAIRYARIPTNFNASRVAVVESPQDALELLQQIGRPFRRPHNSFRQRPMKSDTTHQFRLGPICSQDELEELWAIDNAAYGAASITYEKFRDWWRAFPSGLLVLHWGRRIGGAIGLWPLSERTAPRLTNGQMKEADLTGEMTIGAN